MRGGEGRRGLALRGWAIHRKKLQGSILRGAARRNRGSRRRICTLPSAPVPCAQVALVGQEPVLFSGSVRDNIAYGLRSCEDDKVIAAARAAHAYDFISEMKHGLYTGIFTLSVNRGSGTYSWGEGCVPVTHLLLPRPPSVPTHCSSPRWAPTLGRLQPHSLACFLAWEQRGSSASSTQAAMVPSPKPFPNGALLSLDGSSWEELLCTCLSPQGEASNLCV